VVEAYQISIVNKNQQDAPVLKSFKKLFYSLLFCSTCFGHSCAHHQISLKNYLRYLGKEQFGQYVLRKNRRNSIVEWAEQQIKLEEREAKTKK
jgi:hypothetical protein